MHFKILTNTFQNSDERMCAAIRNKLQLGRLLSGCFNLKKTDRRLVSKLKIKQYRQTTRKIKNYKEKQGEIWRTPSLSIERKPTEKIR